MSIFGFGKKKILELKKNDCDINSSLQRCKLWITYL